MLVALQLVTVAAVPLNVTVLVPCEAPKFVPVIVTEVPTGPAVGFNPAIERPAVVTVKLTALLAWPPMVTTTLPVVALAGTVVTILVALQLVTVAAVPLNVTVLVPCEAPKFVPVIVTEVPTGPAVGFNPVIESPAAVTVKLTALLALPPTVTTTLPVLAPAGTGAVMLVALQLVGLLAIPLNVIVLVLCVAPKLLPEIVTGIPPGPELGVRLDMVGAGKFTVNATPLLAWPSTVTTTLPVVAPTGTVVAMLVALQLVTVAAVPLNVTVLVPCVAPRFVPVMVTEVPAGPEVGVTLEIPGAGCVTVNAIPLLEVPPTMTTTFPVAAPLGTVTTMLVALQLVGVPVVPANLTELLPCVAAKFAPLTVTTAPTGPDVGLKLVMLGLLVVPPPPLVVDDEQPNSATTTSRSKDTLRNAFEEVSLGSGLMVRGLHWHILKSQGCWTTSLKCGRVYAVAGVHTGVAACTPLLSLW
jgi:hypothetical protein